MGILKKFRQSRMIIGGATNPLRNTMNITNEQSIDNDDDENN